MAKELPFFKFEPQAWDTGNIQMCSRESKGLFTDLCSLYWSRLGELPYALALQKLCNGSKDALQELIEHDIFGVIDGNIVIEFLDEQLLERNLVSEERRKAAKKRWSDAKALQEQYKSNASRGEEKREEKKKKEENRENGAGPPATLTLDDRVKKFRDKCLSFVDQFGEQMVQDFFDYWTEINDGGYKMRFEMEKVFNTGRRLSTWKKRQRIDKAAKSKTEYVKYEDI